MAIVSIYIGALFKFELSIYDATLEYLSIFLVFVYGT